MWHMRNNTEESDHILKLYLKSDYVFKPACKRIEKGLPTFKMAIERKLQLQRNQRHLKPRLNLSPLSFDLMQHLKNNDIYIVVHGDKNLGPCILERNFYIFKGFA